MYISKVNYFLLLEFVINVQFIQRTHLLKGITYINELGNRVFKWDEEVQAVSEEEYKKISAVLPIIQSKIFPYGAGTAKSV